MEIETKNATLSDRLNYALELTGVRKAALARAINVTPQVIQFLCNSNTQASRFTFEIAAALGLNTHWLATGEGSIFLSDDPKHRLFEIYEEFPVLTENQIIAQTNGKKIDSSRNELILIKKGKKGIFCTEVLDSAMEPIIPKRSIAIFSSDQIEIKPQAIVLAHLKCFGTTVIRKITEKNGVNYLTPCNNELYKDYQLNSDVSLLGHLIELRWQFAGG